MAMAIETSIVRYIGTGAEVTDGTLWNLKAPLGSTFYAADINHRYVYDGKAWSPLTPEAAGDKKPKAAKVEKARPVSEEPLPLAEPAPAKQ